VSPAPGAPGGAESAPQAGSEAAIDAGIVWADAVSAAALFAVDPHGLGGVLLRCAHGPVRERWLAMLRQALPEGTPWRRMPAHIGDERLLGGIDLAATLRAGRPVAQAGLLAQADGGIVIVPMAERLPPATAARIGAAIDRGHVDAQREGFALRSPARIGVVALDEGAGDDEALAPALTERLGFQLDLSSVPARDLGEAAADVAQVLRARHGLASVQADDATLTALCAAAQALGVDSVRAELYALRAARAAAALRGAGAVGADDAALAARLVLAPRATRWPQPVEEVAEEAEAPAEPPDESTDDDATEAPPQAPDAQADAPPPPADTPAPADPGKTQPLEEQLIDAARAAIPAGLLALLQGGSARERRRNAGRAGQAAAAPRGGRPVGSRRGELRSGARLHLIDTLRAAAPWQRLRLAAQGAPVGVRRIVVRPEDFHVVRSQRRSATTTLFVIDASGSSALHRLAEAKGAVELLLADCYVRRDEVGVIAFRGAGAELLLQPTRSLVRAKRSLAGLPGGGGTPLAGGLVAATTLALAVRRSGATPLVVLLTDGRANIALDGTPGRQRARDDAQRAARGLRAQGVAALLVDTSAQPEPAAVVLAAAMGASYVALPHAAAQDLSRTVRALPAFNPGARG
jgi:magnesium chelatase subunit D